MTRNRIIPIFVPHAGCPHQCVFCNQKRIAGAGTPLTGDAVRQTLEEGLRHTQQAEAAFYGGSFTAIPVNQQTELLAAVQPYLQAGSIRSVRLSTRPDAVNEETALRLKRFGVRTVELGSQSMSDAVLKASGRGHTAEDTVRAVRILKQAGLQVVLQMMTGLPGSSRETDRDTARRLFALQPDGIRIYPTVVIRDTPLFRMFEAGKYVPQTVEEAADECAKLYRLFDAAGISVLRMGLQPTEELDGGGAVAGPYHPAFGELVKSRILYENAADLLHNTEAKTVTLLVRQDRVSAMVGQHRSNLRLLQRQFPEKRIKVGVSDCGAWEIRLQSDEKPDTIT